MYTHACIRCEHHGGAFVLSWLGLPNAGDCNPFLPLPLHLLLLVKLKQNVISLGSSGIRASYLLDVVR